MAVFSTAAVRSTQQGTFQFYLSNGTSKAETELAADLTGAMVFRGEAGARRARALLDTGWHGRLWLDAARYDKDHTRAGDLVLWDEDPWLAQQRSLGVVEPLSPGTYVPGDDRAALGAAIRRETSWLSASGSGRLSLALDGSWLTHDPTWLANQLRSLDLPLSLAFGHPNDPLGQRGAAAGLVALLDAVPNVMLVRSDIGALGALAHGAVAGAIGTGTSVRHVVPPGRAAGGARTGLPSVFLGALKDWKLPTVLARFPQHLVPRCDLECCGGERLDRFGFTADAHDARVHNLTSLAAEADQLLAVQPSHRAAAFKVACREAVHEAARIELLGAQPFEVSQQVAAWAQL